MIRKEALIILVIFCITAVLFTAIPVSSMGTYDPWLDSNGDGKVDLKDVYATDKAYGTSGDPTRNVNVTNWPIEPLPTLEKRTQRIQIMESTANGLIFDATSTVWGEYFVFDFEPIGTLNNITQLYMIGVWRTSDNQGYFFQYQINTYGTYFDEIAQSANPRAWWNSFVYRPETNIKQGINQLAIYGYSTNPTGNIILYKFELVIEYWSWA